MTKEELANLLTELRNICDTELLGQNSIEEGWVRQAVYVIEKLAQAITPNEKQYCLRAFEREYDKQPIPFARQTGALTTALKSLVKYRIDHLDLGDGPYSQSVSPGK